MDIYASINCVKYLYKYVYKGYDRGRVKIGYDECEHHMDIRYMTGNEAHAHISNFLYLKNYTACI